MIEDFAKRAAEELPNILKRAREVQEHIFCEPQQDFFLGKIEEVSRLIPLDDGSAAFNAGLARVREELALRIARLQMRHGHTETTLKFNQINFSNCVAGQYKLIVEWFPWEGVSGILGDDFDDSSAADWWKEA